MTDTAQDDFDFLTYTDEFGRIRYVLNGEVVSYD